MADLKKESKLYQELSEKCENVDYTLELFNECIEIAKKADPREIKYVLFNLKALYEKDDTGIDKAIAIVKMIQAIAGNSLKASFIICVLNTALEEIDK
ncbi:hypothetical protein [Eubacterium ventriosum]|jgi:hypothetical protein|uniref:hypothetical protein n=1 Tax=Eubacterium ventriosum TaxID=39496 RepID=UPI003520353F